MLLLITSSMSVMDSEGAEYWDILIRSEESYEIFDHVCELRNYFHLVVQLSEGQESLLGNRTTGCTWLRCTSFNGKLYKPTRNKSTTRGVMKSQYVVHLLVYDRIPFIASHLWTSRVRLPLGALENHCTRVDTRLFSIRASPGEGTPRS